MPNEPAATPHRASTSTEPPDDTVTLTRLAQSMESLRPDGSQPAWAEVIGPVDRPIRVKWHSDIATMVGFVAPTDCDAIAVVGYGWARHVHDESASNTSVAPGKRRRCRVVCVMARSGEVAGYLRAGLDILLDEPPTVGRVPDCIRRCFRLPTSPPVERTDCLLALFWLTNMIGAGERADGPLDWPTAARLHPALQVATSADITIPLDDLVAVLRVAADAWSWTALARQAAGPGWVADMLPATVGGWMDEGILARWLLSSLAPVESLLDQVTPLLDPAAVVDLRRTLNEIGVLATG